MQTVERIQESSGRVKETQDAITAVTQHSQTAAGLVEEISAIAQQQAEGVGPVNTALAETDTTTQENAAETQELTNAMTMFKTGNGEAAKA